jgi:hypothetical protein
MFNELIPFPIIKSRWNSHFFICAVISKCQPLFSPRFAKPFPIAICARDSVAFEYSLGLQASQVLVDNGGDWERRNRLKVYEATYRLAIRDFSRAAGLLLDSIATFTASELYAYPQV